MTHDEILAKLTGLFQDIFDDDDLDIGLETTANDVADWDSVSHITLIVAVEQMFGIKIKTAEIESLKNVGDLVQIVSGKLN
jgi:acyl carrier protein